MRAAAFFFLFVFALSSASFAAPLEKPFDHSTWDAFLKKYVNEKGEVNFVEVKKDPSLLKKYMRQLRKVNETDFPEWSREEVAAVWINGYHAAAIWAVIEHYPLKNLQEIASVWDTRYLKMTGNSYSLNDIRTRFLVGTYHDEKLHFALSCMAKDCPVLSRDAYVGPKLDGQLFMAVRRFVNDDHHVSIRRKEKKVFLSKLFKWYGKDFNFNFGKPENEEGLSKEEFAILSFVSFYIEDVDKVNFLEEKNYKIKYPKFDWSLNEWRA